MSKDNSHHWRFFRAGGVDQARIETGDDLRALEHLDQKLWVALSCPVKGLEFDEKTLALIDSDKDGRVRVKEVIDAVNWTISMIKNADELSRESETLPLASIDDSKPQGKQLLASARQILTNLGKASAAEIGVADFGDEAKIFGQTRFNGDGVITAGSAEDAGLKALIGEIIATQGGEPDRSGSQGISQARIDGFFKAAEAFVAWHKVAGDPAAAILPLGENTAAAFAAYKAVKLKIDDFFARCRLAAFDSRALEALNRKETEYLELCARDFSISAAEVAGFPLARIEAGKPLPLEDGINPAWAGAIAALRKAAIEPLLGKGKTTLPEPEWEALGGRFAAYEKWLASKAGVEVEKLGVARIREILAGKGREKLTALVGEDKALEPHVNAIASVEKLARFYRDLFHLLKNFVSFEDFYSRKRKAVFQTGTLYLDGRACELCMRVEDMGRHGAMAHLSKTYIAYVDCTRLAAGGKMTIAAAFTGGDSDHLMVGRNGLFYDRKGNDWEATIIKVIENPISIRQAFLSPYKRLMRWIEEQIAKHAAAADSAATDRLTAGASEVGASAAAGKPPAPRAKLDIGIVAALGVAVGGVTAAFGAILQAFFGLGMWMPLGFAALILLISGPAMVIAWLKLRQRNLGPILDANGWAINGRVRINVPFGGALTSVARLPPGSSRSLTDPYGRKKSRWPVYLVFAVLFLAGAALILNEQGKLHEWFKIGKQVDKAAAPAEGKDPRPADPAAPATPPAPAAQPAQGK